MSGLLDHIEQAAHISAGIGCSFREAQEIVKAATNYAAKRDPADAWANVIYVDFATKRRR